MAEDTLKITKLPVGSIKTHAHGVWGVWMLVFTEAALFAYLLFSYYYFAAQHGRQFMPAELLSFRLSLPNTIILITTSVVMWLGERGLKKRGASWQLALGLFVALVLGCVFVGIQVLEWRSHPFSLWTDPFGSLYFTITGFHVAHVVAGLLMIAALLVWTLLGYFDKERHSQVPITSIYWHFVDAVWLTIFFSFYIMPRLWW